MYLKSIDVVGFKSFADRTRIELKPGITGVIGPNGCGKSNVMDSIRWCIGEMSWKALRSDSMVSVIFAGTARRNPTSMAEVTLTFDNAQSMLPVQYSEVSVSRRLFRSGESEYYLNRTQCRLRDIRELFLDTGIGSDGYAIIDQGNVSFVLEAKPEERRALFEEAAGVSKYKAKREEALRKLEKVEIDLGQLSTSTTLIEEQIKKLDADARKAELYKKYKAELSVLESRQTVGEIDAAEAEIAREQETTAPLLERHAQLKVEVEAEEGRLAALRLEKAAVDGKLVETNAAISDLKVEGGALQGRITSAENNRTFLVEQIAQSEKDAEHDRAALAALEPQIAGAREQVEKAEGAVAAALARRSAFSAELAAAREGQDAAQAGVDASAADALKAAERTQSTVRELAQQESRVEHNIMAARTELRELERTLGRLAGGRVEVERARLNLNERKAWTEESRLALERLEGAHKDAVRELEEARLRVQTLREEEVQLKARVESLEAQGSRDPYWVGAHALIEAGLPGVLGTVQSVLRAEEPWRTHLEDALGERLYAVLCADPDAARAGIRFLRDAGRGRARMLVLSTLSQDEPSRQLPPDAKPLLEHVQFDPAYERAMRHLLSECYAYGGELYGTHWVCGGSGDTAGAAPKLSELLPARERLALIATEGSAVQGRRAEAETALVAAEERLRAARDIQSVETQKFNHAAAELRHSTDLLPAIEEDAALVEKHCAELLVQIAEAKELRIGHAARLKGLREDEGRLEVVKGEAVRRRDDARAAVVGLEAQESQFEQTLQTLREHESNTRSHLERIEGGRREYESSLGRRLEQRQAWERKIDEEKSSEAEARTALDALRVRLAEGEGAAQALFAKAQEHARDAENMEKGLHDRRAEFEGLGRQLQDSELRVATVRGRLESQLRRLTEEIGLTLEAARAQHKDQEAVDPERVQFLKRRIEALGNVNLAAPEEYEALVGRRDYLKGQVDDLNKAKDDLRTAINRINATTRENFRQTFNEVRDHFRRLYSVLFEGGEADIILTDEENMLETGVEIMAQPPGKRLQSISLLSGGEKTLTAIALLFSFFMVKPSPICMLDEADAALDDANVDRFVSMLRQFSGRSQFLIVSHNKKTMEACDVMYGVTMEESGVSQIISVDFRKPGEREAAARMAAQTEGPFAMPEPAPLVAAGAPAEPEPAASADAGPETSAAA
ncbi:MAG: chromosome segregation protein SMC [Elusimicrobiota bacterium]|jgi:chromosome segregation protein